MVDDANSEHTKTLAIIDIPDRTLADVQWSTGVENVQDTRSWTTPPKVLINPNTVVLIDERDNKPEHS